MGSPVTDPCRDSDEQQHWVVLTRTFEISATEVTQAQFSAQMGYNPSSDTSCGADCPVETVTWHEAAAYAAALSSAAGLSPCYACTGAGPSVSCTVSPAYSSGGKTILDCPGYRMPTEAEWEYAYRAGTSTALYSGAVSACLGNDAVANKIGWYSKNTTSIKPVGKKLPNAWGLYDMAGNVEEHVHDGYSPYDAATVTDPVLPLVDEKHHSRRGGQWRAYPADMRAADRNRTDSVNTAAVDIGFRVARTQ